MTLAERIEERIREMPACNPGYLAVVPETLGRVLHRELIRKIAEVAAAEAGREALPYIVVR